MNKILVGVLNVFMKPIFLSSLCVFFETDKSLLSFLKEEVSITIHVPVNHRPAHDYVSAPFVDLDVADHLQENHCVDSASKHC